MRHQQKESSDRRLFQAFEQSVDCALLHIIGRIDDNYPSAAQRWPRKQPLLHPANLINRDVTFGLEWLALSALLFLIVIRGQMIEGDDIRVCGNGWLWHSSLGHQFSRCGLRKVSFTYPAQPTENPSMMHS